MNRLVQTAKNPYVFSVLSKLFIVLFGFAYMVCQSRYLGAALKGDVAYISSITQITSIIFGIGVHQSYPYYKKITEQNVAPFFLKLALGMGIIYTSIALILAVFIHQNFKIAAVFLMTPLLVYTRIVSYINMVETPNKKNAAELIVDVAQLFAVILLWLTVPPSAIWGICLLVIKDLLLAVIYTWRLRAALLTPIKLKKAEIINVLKYGIFPMLTLLMTTLNYRVDVIMLKQFVSSADVGIYSVGVLLAERVWTIPDAMKEVMISNLAKGRAMDEVSFVIRVCNTTCIIVIIFIVLFGQLFIDIFFGFEYKSAYSITVFILIGVIFMIYYKVIGSYNIVHGKQKENFCYLLISVIGNIIANAVLIPAFGNTGAALASVFSYAIAAFLFTRKYIKDTGSKIENLLIINRHDMEMLKIALTKNN